MKKLFACLAVGGLLVAVQPAALAGSGCCPGAGADEAKTQVKAPKAEADSVCADGAKKSDCSDKKDCSDEAKENCTRDDKPVAKVDEKPRG